MPRNNVKGIIVGNPVNMDGSYGPATQSITDICNNVLKNLNLPICLWDERLSTVGAFNLSSELDVNVSKRTRNIDKNAAAFILQGAIDYLNKIGISQIHRYIDNLTEYALNKLSQIKDLKIYIKGDKKLNYGKIMDLMTFINKSGFKKVML